MKKVQLFIGILGVFILINIQPVSASLILQDVHNAAVQIQVAEPLGQSFTAEDPSVLIAFSLFDVNKFNPNLPMTMHLLEGDGVGGAELDSVSQLLPPDTGSIGDGVFLDFDFSSTILTIGNSYTALIDAQNSRWGLDYTDSDVYAGGTMYAGGSSLNRGDLRFRITPAEPVPEPTTMLLLGTGLVGLAGTRLRRKQK